MAGAFFAGGLRVRLAFAAAFLAGAFFAAVLCFTADFFFALDFGFIVLGRRSLASSVALST